MADGFDFRRTIFSTPDTPDGRWLERFCDEFGRKHLHVAIKLDKDAPTQLSGASRVLPDFGVPQERKSPSLNRNFVADATDDVLALILTVAGDMALRDHGRDNALQPNAVMADGNNEEGILRTHTDSEFISLHLRRHLIRPLVPDIDDHRSIAIPADNQALRLLLGYLRLLDAEKSIASPEMQQMMTLHIHDLAAQVFRTVKAGDGLIATPGLRAARLAEVKADILGHLTDPQLSVAAVGARLGLTPRYIHMLFEDEEETFSEYVVGQRLLRAHRMLTDFRFAERMISTIALDVGFSDLSYFNRTFRRRFGATPSDVRQQINGNG